jgi:hypothetical protein
MPIYRIRGRRRHKTYFLAGWQLWMFVWVPPVLGLDLPFLLHWLLAR